MLDVSQRSDNDDGIPQSLQIPVQIWSKGPTNDADSKELESTELQSLGYFPPPCLLTYRLANQILELKPLHHSVARAGFWAGYSIPLPLPRVIAKLV